MKQKRQSSDKRLRPAEWRRRFSLLRLRYHDLCAIQTVNLSILVGIPRRCSSANARSLYGGTQQREFASPEFTLRNEGNPRSRIPNTQKSPRTVGRMGDATNNPTIQLPLSTGRIRIQEDRWSLVISAVVVIKDRSERDPIPISSVRNAVTDQKG